MYWKKKKKKKNFKKKKKLNQAGTRRRINAKSAPVHCLDVELTLINDDPTQCAQYTVKKKKIPIGFRNTFETVFVFIEGENVDDGRFSIESTPKMLIQRRLDIVGTVNKTTTRNMHVEIKIIW